ncbi:MAG: ABC transporter permease [Gemmatimonadota bacterium]|nr:ABC transporter permease [Gemmatimonadota bacterium]
MCAFESIPAWRRYLRFWKPDIAADLDEELAFHLQSRIEESVASGMTAEQARADALRRFGDLEQIRATCHTLGQEREIAMRRQDWWESVQQDVRFSIRQLLRNRGLTTVAVITLALGIGANTAIFSLVNAVLLRPLPYANADRMVQIHERWGEQYGEVSIGNFADLRAQSRAFELMSAYQGRSFNLSGAGEPERLSGAKVTASYFRTAYMPPALGRYFLPEEDVPGVAKVAVLSEALWQSHFAADRGVLGRSIELNGERYAIVGVAPAGYTLTPEDDQIWVPAAFTPEQLAQHDEHVLTVIGLLRPGMSIEQAQADLAPLARALGQRYPQTGTTGFVGVVDFRRELISDYRTQLLVLLGAVVLVLLIACANVANLLLARAAARQKEIAIRTALGAARARIMGQLLTESLVLSLVGGVAGLIVARAGIRFLVTAGPSSVPRLAEAGLDGRVLAFSLAVTVLCGLVFGLAPALRAARAELHSTLKEGGKSSAMGSSRDRLRNALVVSEVAIALVLLVGAGLLIRSAMLLQRVNPGFDPSNVLSARLALPSVRYGTPGAFESAFQRIADEAGRMAGVQSAAVVSTTPFSQGPQNGLVPEGRPFDPKSAIDAAFRLASPGYFTTMRIPLKQGRLLDDRDIAAAPRVMVINETLAKEAWPGQSPIGKRIACCEAGPDGKSPSWKEVVGVVGDVHARGLGSSVPPEFYLPLHQAPRDAWRWLNGVMTIVVRGGSDPALLAGPLRASVRDMDPTIPLYNVRTMSEMMAQSTASTRFNMMLLTLLGATGLVLAAVGIYGVIAYFVTQRTHEIGVRMALGAGPGQVRAMVVRQGAMLALGGVAIGVVGGLATTRILSGMLFGVRATDPVTFAGVGILLAAVAALASYIPARRATRVDPLEALRSS